MFWCLHGWLICPLLINNTRARESIDIMWALTAFYVKSALYLITCRHDLSGMRLNQHVLKPCCWCQCDCLMARNIFSVTVVFYRRAVARPNVFFFKNSVMSTIKIRFIRTLPEKCTTLALTAHSNCSGTGCYQHSTMSLPHTLWLCHLCNPIHRLK